MKENKEKQFVYDPSATPVENYDRFQKSIAMSRGVGFAEGRDSLNHPVLFLHYLPGLSLNLDEIRKTYLSFQKDVLNHVRSIVNKGEDGFLIYSSVYDIYNRIKNDLNAVYATRAFPYVGATTAKSFKEIRQMGILPIRGRYNASGDLEWNSDAPKPVLFEQLGTELKEFINRVVEFWISYNKKLLVRLEPILTGLFEDKHRRHFRYNGDAADIVEIAIAIVLTKKLAVFGKKKLTLNSFTQQLAAFLGISLNNVADHRITLHYRFESDKSFLSSSIKNVKEYLAKLP